MEYIPVYACCCWCIRHCLLPISNRPCFCSRYILCILAMHCCVSNHRPGRSLHDLCMVPANHNHVLSLSFDHSLDVLRCVICWLPAAFGRLFGCPCDCGKAQQALNMRTICSILYAGCHRVPLYLLACTLTGSCVCHRLVRPLAVRQCWQAAPGLQVAASQGLECIALPSICECCIQCLRVSCHLVPKLLT